MSDRQPVTVVGYDGSPAAERALEYAIDRHGRGALHIVHAWQPSSAMRGSEVFPMLAATSLAAAEARVDALADRHPRLAGVDWSAEVVDGHPAEVLVDRARTRGAAEIVVGTRGHGRMRSVLGSTALDLLHISPCPVVVVPPLDRSWPLPSVRSSEAPAPR